MLPIKRICILGAQYLTVGKTYLTVRDLDQPGALWVIGDDAKHRLYPEWFFDGGKGE